MSSDSGDALHIPIEIKTDDSAEDPYHESSPESVMQYLKSFKG